MRTLTKNEIEVKVKTVSEKGAVLLLYKTARVDMAILDETFGSMNWQSDYKVVKDNLYCGIGVLNKDTKDWIWKWDCGIESRPDEEGNEKKGEASDAFKRAGFKWGIGVELYSAPFTFARVETEGYKDERTGKMKYKLKNPFQKFYVDEITYDENDDIARLVIVDDKGNIVFSTASERQPEKKPAQPKDDKYSKENLLKTFDSCVAAIAKHGEYAENESDYDRVSTFADTLFRHGLKEEAMEVRTLLEQKTKKDNIPY